MGSVVNQLSLLSSAPTTGDLIRQLRPYFESSYDLNIAVNNYRRKHGSKNWVVAATGLLSKIEKDIELWIAIQH